MARSYSERTIKMLWSRSAGRCAFPTCHVKCDIPAEDERDNDALIGQMAHIFAYSDELARPNPNMLTEDKNDYNNLLILCANDHIRVDNQENAYTVDVLKQWKQDLEQWVDQQLESSNLNISFLELEMVTAALLQNPNMPPSTDFSLLTPLEKMGRNSLTDETLRYMNMGMLQAPQVSSYVRHEARINSMYPEQLKAGFLGHYNNMVRAAISGDELFREMWDFASQGSVLHP